MKKILPLLLLTGLSASCFAQLNHNPNKFLGNITTMGQIRTDFDKYWDQLTPENETKWESIERSPGVFDFSTAKREYQYCKEHGFKFKFHALLWGAQIPSYLQQLNAEETLAAITRWFDAVAKEFPDLEYIDVANEAIKGNNGQGNYHSPYQMTKIIQALGGEGKTGYDWLAKAFVMARERWPKAVLIYNDYNTFQWDTDEYIKVINAIKAAGGPIDAAGCQSHDLNDMKGDDFKKALEKIHDGVELPIFISEYDINKADDDIQLTRYKEQFPIMWEADYVAGVTLWGYIYGATWVDDGDEKGASGLIKNGVERPALQWLREYMQTDAALNAKSPLISVASDYAFISTSANVVLIGDTATIKAKANCDSTPVAEMRIYVDSTNLIAKADTTSIELKWSPLEKGDYTFTLKALSSVSSTIFERSCSIKACEPAKPFHGTPIALPGKLEAEDFDLGENTIAYTDNDEANNGQNTYRTSSVDIDKNDGDGWVVGWTNTGEWMQYTVTVEKEQFMLFTARVSSGTNGSAFSIYMGNTNLTGKINVPQTGNNSWGTYTEIKGLTKVAMPAGTYPIRIQIEGSSCNIDYVLFETATGDEVFTEAYNGTPATIPGTIEAEEYDKAKDGYVAETYKDNDTDNQGDAKFRTTEGVDIVVGNGGKVIGYTNAGEWTLYTVNIENTQKYYWGAVVSSGTSGASFRLYIDNEDITGKINIPQTGNNDWSKYKIVKGETKIELPEGIHTLMLAIEGANGNIDKMIFSTEPIKDLPNIVTDIVADELNGQYMIYSIMGVYQETVTINNGNIDVLNEILPKGIYILREKNGNKAKKVIVY